MVPSLQPLPPLTDLECGQISLYMNKVEGNGQWMANDNKFSDGRTEVPKEGAGGWGGLEATLAIEKGFGHTGGGATAQGHFFFGLDHTAGAQE